MEFRDLLRDELAGEIDVFLEDEISPLVSCFIGVPFDASSYIRDTVFTDEQDNERTLPYLHECFDTCFEFAKSGIWDGDDFWDTILDYSIFLSIKLPDDFNDLGLGASKRTDHKLVVEAVWARLALNPELFDGNLEILGAGEVELGFVSRRQLAVLSGLAEDTIRAATYHDGENKLNTLESGLVDVEEAIRWLTVKGKYQPTKIKVDMSYTPKGMFNSVGQLVGLIEHRLEHKGLDWDDICKRLEGKSLDSFTSFSQMRNGGDQKYKLLDWFDTEIALHLSEMLYLDPLWLTETAVKFRNELQLKSALQEIEVAANSTKIMADNFHVEEGGWIDSLLVSKTLELCPWVQVHTRQTKKNSKMDGYQSLSGKTFTHEHNLKKQYFWMDEKLLSEGLDECKFGMKHYLSSDLKKSKDYGRHSGLKKYPELADANLIKVHISSSKALEAILNLMK
jgi:hypothetical protein